ncbi:type II toxin-antitoxin system RelE/ParE family toxin [Blastopirellula retiformator]|uniref:Plasmid stabilization system protein n=1 Tax=Blastopirellula retiformator TaxID=2527970 RepID=A0A5C5UWD6_9BACT|nr:type II toxin-antitoxin system RelE/ParE family toxin [Blastopirellula retiformator]TWT29867.1 Plasmid stabilization system protein [Blastopirellula retiformator]
MKRNAGNVQLLLTDRALADLAEIRTYTAANFGKRQSEKYLDDLESALARIKEQPDLLRHEAQFSATLQFYRVNRHLVVCDRSELAIYVLTVIHGNRDIPSRLNELAPSLADEVEILRGKL